MFTRLFLITVFIAAAGCATHPVSNSAALPVPGSRIIDSRFLQLTPNSGIVTVKRDSGFGGGQACSVRVFINAEPFADVNTSEKVVAYLPAGDYVISAKPNGICGGGLVEVATSVKSGAKLNFRIGYGSDANFMISATAF